MLGFEIAANRQHMDQYEKTLIVPNSLHPVKEDGFVMSWMLHANAHGRVMLMVITGMAIEVVFYMSDDNFSIF